MCYLFINLTLAFVKTRLLDHEVKLRNESSDTSAKILHVETKNNTINKRKFNDPQQNNIGYQNNKHSKSLQFLKCHHCGRKGHKKSDCYYFKRMNLQKRNFGNNDRTRTVQAVEIYQQPSTSNDFSGFAFMTGDYQEEEQGNNIRFLLDSGAADHIINREDLFIDHTDLSTPLKISIAKTGEFISATKKGTLQVTSNMGIQGVLEGVLFCREVPYNLLSVSKIQQAGYTIIFDQDGAKICKNGKAIMQGMCTNNLIAVDFIVPVSASHPVSRACTNDKKSYKLWHQRLRHISIHKFLEIKQNKLFEDGMNQIDLIVPDKDLCEACINGKQSRHPFSRGKEKNILLKDLFVSHSDVCGPITPTTIDNKNYLVTFIDQCTHYCVAYLITYESDVFAAFKDFVAKSEAKFDLKVVNLYCDNGGEIFIL